MLSSPPAARRQHNVGDEQALDDDDDTDDGGRARDIRVNPNPTGIPIPRHRTGSHHHHHHHQQTLRPASSLSSNRYRTPMAGSLAMSPPAPMREPSASAIYTQQYIVSQQHPSRPQPAPYVQPLSEYEAASSFPGPSPTSGGGPSPTMGAAALRQLDRRQSADQSRALGASHRVPLHRHMTSSYTSTATSVAPGAIEMQDFASGTISPIERAVVGVQASLAALQERLESLEASAVLGTPPPMGASGTSPYNSRLSLHSQGGGGRRGDPSKRPPLPTHIPWYLRWDPSDFGWEHMGMWSLVLSPAARTTRFLLRVLAFLLPRHSEKPLSPGLLVFRRVLLDVSFTLCMFAVARKLWKRSGMKQGEVTVALQGLWTAIAGSRGDRILVSKGV